MPQYEAFSGGEGNRRGLLGESSSSLIPVVTMNGKNRSSIQSFRTQLTVSWSKMGEDREGRGVAVRVHWLGFVMPRWLEMAK